MPETPVQPVQEEIVLPVVPDEPVTLAVKTVTQLSEGTQKFYGYDENNNLVYFESPKGSWNFVYDNGRIKKILGPKDFVFDFSNGEIVENGVTSTVEYDNGRLITIESNPPLHFEWGGSDDLRIVTRGVAGKTSLDYDDDHNIKYITRGSVTTNIRYDDKDRVRVLNADDVSYIVGYWKDSKLMKVTGSLQGKGMEVSYGPGYPPTSAKIISEDDETTFSAPDTESLYDTVDKYVYCNYVRRLPVPFDGISYTIFHNYFKGSVEDYIILNKICEVIE
jgi:hypothetical protein